MRGTEMMKAFFSCTVYYCLYFKDKVVYWKKLDEKSKKKVLKTSPKYFFKEISTILKCS